MQPSELGGAETAIHRFVPRGFTVPSPLLDGSKRGAPPAHQAFTPAFLVQTKVEAEIATSLRAALAGMHVPAVSGALYAGFADYQEAHMQRFFADLAALPGLARAA